MVGTWSLASYAIVNSEVPFEENEPKANALEDWLYARGREGFSGLKSATGMLLKIDENGRYSESKITDDVKLLWYDVDGAQAESPTPTSGVLRYVPAANSTFLHPTIALSSQRRSREKDEELLRYDDGDTLVCDQVRLEDEVLVRIISVVTDEIYLTRVIAVYKRGL